MAEHAVHLYVGGRIWTGWTEISVTRSMRQLAATFSLAMTERFPGAVKRRDIRPGAHCRVTIAGHTAVEGYIDDCNPGYSATEHAQSVAGRDATGDLVDCSAVHAGGEWRNRRLDDIAADLCAPYGVSVTATVDVGEPFGTYAIQPSETVFECISRAARMRGILVMSDGARGLILGRASTVRSAAVLRRGVNILSASARFSHRDRFSTYTIKGQAEGTDEWHGEQAASPSVVVTDPGISRYRPRIVLAEDQATPASSSQRAIWLRNVALGQSAEVTVAVQGWLRDGQRLWTPNTLVRLTDDWLALDEDLLISAVSFGLSESGSTTTLTLIRPEALSLAPQLPAPSEGSWTL